LKRENNVKRGSFQDLQKITGNSKIKLEFLMKVFCFIFTIYILFLSLQPCEEMTALAELRAEKVSHERQIQAGEQAGEKTDDCSPFCICSCCHFSTVYQLKSFSVTNKITVSAISRPNFSYQNPYYQNYKTSIWQPPKFNSIG